MTGRAAGAVVTGVGLAFPPPVAQQELLDGFFAAHFGNRRAARAAFGAAGVSTRHAALNPLVEDCSSWSTGRRMARFVEEALPLGKESLAAALGESRTDPADLGLLVVTSCTGYATPGLDVLLARDLGCAPTLRRLLVGHVGCHAALPSLASASEYVAAHGRPAAVLCLELPSLHLQPPSADLEQAVVHALFGDAAAAVVLTPPPTRRAEASGGTRLDLLATEAITVPGTTRDMTWTVTDAGFRMSLARSVPVAAAAAVGPLVADLLGALGAERSAVTRWAVHPGGPRVLDEVGSALGLGGSELAASRAVLDEHGNCSSATAFLVLDRLRRTDPPRDGELLVALAFGPGLTIYAAAFRAT